MREPSLSSPQPPPLLELQSLCAPAASRLTDLSQAQISQRPLLPAAQGCPSSRSLGVRPRVPGSPSSPHPVCQYTPALYCTKNSQSSSLAAFPLSFLISPHHVAKVTLSKHVRAGDIPLLNPRPPLPPGASVVLMVKVVGPCLQPDATALGPHPASQPTTFQSLRQATFFPTSEPQTCSALPSAWSPCGWFLLLPLVSALAPPPQGSPP